VKQKAFPKPPLAAAALAGFVLVLVAGYLLLIAPKRHEAARLGKQIADVQNRIDVAQAPTPRPAAGAPQIRVADLFRLSRAMPDTVGIADVLLELSGVAQETGVTFKSVTPGPPQTATGYQVVPIDLVFNGHFYDLADFLYRLRNLVGVHAGTLTATGRLFSVESVNFNQGDVQFPEVQASIRVDAFVYGTGTPSAPQAPSAAIAAPATPTGTSTVAAPTSSVPTDTGTAPVPAAPAPSTVPQTGGAR
jgi:hypothetical protein